MFCKGLHSGWLRKLVFLVSVVLIASCSNASNGPAPLNADTGQRIAAIFKQSYREDFQQDISKVGRSAFPTKSQAAVYAKYMNKAFNKAGYSLDKTLLSYLKSPRTPQVILFMSALNLETYAIFLKSDVGEGFLEAGAVTEETLQYAKDTAKEVPINNPDYTLNALPGYKIASISDNGQPFNLRSVGTVRRGKDDWAGWLYLQADAISEYDGVGLVSVAAFPPGEAEIWESLIDKKIKLEGVALAARTMGAGGVAGSTYLKALDRQSKVFIKKL